MNQGASESSHIWTRLIISISGSICIVQNPLTNSQNHFIEHRRPVTAITLHPNGEVVASGEQGYEPSIYVWSIGDGIGLSSTRPPRTKAHLKTGKGITGISALSFSKDGVCLIAAAVCQEYEVGWRGRD